MGREQRTRVPKFQTASRPEPKSTKACFAMGSGAQHPRQGKTDMPGSCGRQTEIDQKNKASRRERWRAQEGLGTRTRRSGASGVEGRRPRGSSAQGILEHIIRSGSWGKGVRRKGIQCLEGTRKARDSPVPRGD